ncbi:MAG: NADP-dependent isocitrate dehydrogenase [Bacteroidota bacterium]|nr:NADP-dependent isocitrate dehydrogenase [Bacteroidota bacterium]
MSEKINFWDGKLIVPDQPIIPFIEGDGIGKDIAVPSVKVIDAAVAYAYNGDKKIEWKEVFAGEKAFNQTGSWLPDETVDAFREYRVGIKGPLTTPIGGGIRSLNVALRQSLDLFVCLRPVRWFKGVPSPVNHPENVNMYIFRENTEDIYAGIEYMYGEEDTIKLRDFLIHELGVNKIRFPETSSFGIKSISKEGSERLVRAAISYAVEQKLPSVTIVHKGNIMKFTEGAFKNWGYQVAEQEFSTQTFTWPTYERLVEEKGKEYADNALNEAREAGLVIIKDVITDAFLQETLLRPQEYSVIATMNLNGDYISDQLAAMVGGIGIAPGGNINYLNGYAIFEATHGTAPKIAGTGQANPASFILSGAMMLDYMGWNAASDLILQALEDTITQRKVTADLYALMEDASLVSTERFAELIIRNMK